MKKFAIAELEDKRGVHQDITYHQISPIKMDIKTFFEALDLIQLSRSEEIVDKQCIKEQ